MYLCMTLKVGQATGWQLHHSINCHVVWGKILIVIQALILVKVKCTLIQALRFCTGCVTHRGSRSIALPFHDHGTRRGWGVSPIRSLPPGKTWYPLCLLLECMLFLVTANSQCWCTWFCLILWEKCRNYQAVMDLGYLLTCFGLVHPEVFLVPS